VLFCQQEQALQDQYPPKCWFCASITSCWFWQWSGYLKKAFGMWWSVLSKSLHTVCWLYFKWDSWSWLLFPAIEDICNWKTVWEGSWFGGEVSCESVWC